jgi:hypothetical protein
VISHDEDLKQILVGRVNNTSFGSAFTLTGPSGSVTIDTSANAPQPLGKINDEAWTATPTAGKYPPNVPQNGTAALFRCDYFRVDFHPGL